MNESPSVDPLRRYFATHAPAGLIAAFLFGSHARSAAHRDSDVDVAVLLDHAAYRTLGDRLMFRARLGSDLIHVTGNNQVDVLLMNEAPPPLNRAILEVGISLLVTDEATLAEFSRVTVSRALDLQPWLEKWRREQMRRIATRSSEGAEGSPAAVRPGWTR